MRNSGSGGLLIEVDSVGTSAGAAAALTCVGSVAGVEVFWPGIGVFEPDGFAEATVEEDAVDEERRSEMFCLARLFVLARSSASWAGEKDQSRNWVDCR